MGALHLVAEPPIHHFHCAYRKVDENRLARELGLAQSTLEVAGRHLAFAQTKWLVLSDLAPQYSYIQST